MKILVINPGGTSTKISIFEDCTSVFNKNISHTAADLASFNTVFDQFNLRKDLIIKAVLEAGLSLDDFGCVVGRGGLLQNISGGIYTINQAMIDDLKAAVAGEHPANLGAVLAKSIADEKGLPAFVVDPVSVDEFDDISRISGLSDLERPSWMHALNQKAVGRQIAQNLGGKYEDYNFIIAHLGSGISIAAHRKGRMVDGSGGRSNGPFSPERSGDLPAYPLIKLCYSGQYTLEEITAKVSTTGGMFGYLGTKDIREVEKLAESGHGQAQLILQAFIYQVSREISSYGATFCGQVDRIILTGGIAHSQVVVDGIKGQVAYLAPVEVVAGEMEMEALALGALSVLNGAAFPKLYPNPVKEGSR